MDNTNNNTYALQTNSTHIIKPQYFPTDLISPGEEYESPERTAAIVVSREKSYEQSKKYIQQYTQRLPSSPLIDALQDVVDSTDRAIEVMSGIGYMNFRHLQAAGYTLVEIAQAYKLNVLDLMAYLSNHVDAEAHAELDMDCCADAKMQKLITYIYDMRIQSKYEGDKLKQLVYATELLVKRLSHKWVGKFRAATGEDGNAIGGVGMTVNMNIGQIANNLQNNYTPEQQKAAVDLDNYNKQLAQDTAGQNSSLLELESSLLNST